jgi:1,4-alpha-glucan branching enzyme
VLIAEESTAWPGVTRSVDAGGLGFDYKWNMGWMHDTLHYVQEEPIHRRWHHGNLTFGLVYAYSEKFILPLSHDEVVYGKGSLIRKMPGDDWQKFANLRAYLAFMWTHPGKKLLFMGGEIAQWNEWNHDRSIEWELLDYPNHAGVQRLVRDLNTIYRDTRALHRKDFEPDGFRWSVLNDEAQSVVAYLRFGDADEPPALIACNFTPVPRYGYRVGVPRAGRWREAVNTDAGVYGGSNVGNGGWAQAEEIEFGGFPASVALTLPPLGSIILIAV